MSLIAASRPGKINRDIHPVVIIGALFFIFGFITWLNSVLIPYLKIACELNNLEAFFVTFAFYMAYFIMAIPSSAVLKRIGFKKGMSAGLLVMAFGALIFIPAALSRTYILFLLGLFVQGSGLTLLQTASNPYITIIGPHESAAKRISIMGICNKVAGAIAPLVLGSIALKNADAITAKLKHADVEEKIAELDLLAARVIVPYIIIVVALCVLAWLIHLSKLPEVDTDREDETIASANVSKRSVFQFPQLVLGVIALFLYVGVEVLAGDSIISYGSSQGIPMEEAKYFTTYTLIAMIAGYIAGIFLIPKFISQAKALRFCAILGVLFSGLALLTDGYTSVMFIALLGLANSLMWPAIWPLAIAGLGRFTKVGSSFLIMAVVGGALIPLLYGWLADQTTPRNAYWIMIPCYLFILFYAMAGYRYRK